jgi:hypothetical protein
MPAPIQTRNYHLEDADLKQRADILKNTITA